MHFTTALTGKKILGQELALHRAKSRHACIIMRLFAILIDDNRLVLTWRLPMAAVLCLQHDTTAKYQRQEQEKQHPGGARIADGDTWWGWGMLEAAILILALR